MKRQINQALIEWKSSNQRKPLIIDGARQVGKTHAVIKFAEDNYKNFHHFNFESQPKLANCFESSLDPYDIIAKLQVFIEKKIEAVETLIFFDEVQLCPKVLTSLKYFCEQAPEYQVISAGSSLGITLSGGTAFPVGKVNFLKMYPLSFIEFLQATGKQELSEYLSQISLKANDQTFHEELNELFLNYIYLGGMPEVVANFTKNRDFSAARSIQKEILQAYQQDFSKYLPPSETLKVRRIWNSIPNQLARENKKFIFSAITKSARAREYEVALQWLVDSSLVLRSTLVTQGAAPLVSSQDPDVFKVFLHDVGLLGALVDLPQQTLLNGEEMLSSFQGALFENIVAQELVCSLQKELHYWASNGQAEIDFITELDGRVIPIEVKSGNNLRSKSVMAFIKKYEPEVAVRISRSELSHNQKILELPVYMVSQLKRTIQS